MGGGGLPIPMGKAGGGLGLIIVVVMALLFGGNVIGGGGSGDSGLSPGGFEPTPPAGSGAQPGSDEDTVFEFTKFVAEGCAGHVGEALRPRPTGSTRAHRSSRSRAARRPGVAPPPSQTGPFYCPADNKVYLDLSFFQELSRRFGAPGDFAAAYVIAHEIGHHVQTVLGIEADVRRKQQEDRENANVYLVRLELQADCFAGVWARSTYDRGLLESGDLEEGIGAAAAVGDDRLGARSREQWTHGSSELREKWFKTGFDSGDPGDCDTGDVTI